MQLARQALLRAALRREEQARQDFGGEVAAAEDDGGGFPLVAGGLLAEGGHRDGGGAFDQPMLGFEDEAHGVQDFGLSDQDATIDHAAADVQGDGAGLQAAGGAFGEGGLFGHIDDAACAHALVHDGRGLGPASDHFGGGRGRL